MFVILDHPGFRSFHQHGVDLLLGDVGAAVLVDPQQPQAGIGRGRQQPNEGAGQGGEPVHGAGHQTGDALGIELAKALGHQLPHHDGEVSHHHHHDDGGDQATALGGEPPLLQPEGEGLGQQGFAVDTVEQTDAGNADLDGREKMGRVFAQFESNGGGAVAFRGKLAEASLACGDDGDF